MSLEAAHTHLSLSCTGRPRISQSSLSADIRYSGEGAETKAAECLFVWTASTDMGSRNLRRQIGPRDEVSVLRNRDESRRGLHGFAAGHRAQLFLDQLSEAIQVSRGHTSVFSFRRLSHHSHSCDAVLVPKLCWTREINTFVKSVSVIRRLTGRIRSNSYRRFSSVTSCVSMRGCEN